MGLTATPQIDPLTGASGPTPVEVEMKQLKGDMKALVTTASTEQESLGARGVQFPNANGTLLASMIARPTNSVSVPSFLAEQVTELFEPNPPTTGSGPPVRWSAFAVAFAASNNAAELRMVLTVFIVNPLLSVFVTSLSICTSDLVSI
jgi:hypothetical protein